MRKAMRRVLEMEGFATEGFDAAEEFLTSGCVSRAHCLVLDLHLPGMSGIELHEHLREAGNAMPTVFVTAHEDARTRRLVADGANCLIKPFPGEALLQAVSRSIAR